MDSQIEQLPDLTGYLKFASVPRWQRVTLAPIEDRRSPQLHPSAEARAAWGQWRAATRADRCRAPQPRENTHSSYGADYE